MAIVIPSADRREDRQARRSLSAPSRERAKTLQAWIGALHRAGVVLLDEDDASGPGVRLRKGAVVPAPVETKAKPKGRKA